MDSYYKSNHYNSEATSSFKSYLIEDDSRIQHLKLYEIFQGAANSNEKDHKSDFTGFNFYEFIQEANFFELSRVFGLPEFLSENQTKYAFLQKSPLEINYGVIKIREGLHKINNEMLDELEGLYNKYTKDIMAIKQTYIYDQTTAQISCLLNIKECKFEIINKYIDYAAGLFDKYLCLLKELIKECGFFDKQTANRLIDWCDKTVQEYKKIIINIESIIKKEYLIEKKTTDRILGINNIEQYPKFISNSLMLIYIPVLLFGLKLLDKGYGYIKMAENQEKIKNLALGDFASHYSYQINDKLTIKDLPKVIDDYCKKHRILLIFPTSVLDIVSSIRKDGNLLTKALEKTNPREDNNDTPPENINSLKDPNVLVDPLIFDHIVEKLIKAKCLSNKHGKIKVIDLYHGELANLIKSFNNLGYLNPKINSRNKTGRKNPAALTNEEVLSIAKKDFNEELRIDTVKRSSAFDCKDDNSNDWVRGNLGLMKWSSLEPLLH